MSRASVLMQLQGLDLELDAARARLQAIEVILADEAALRAAQQALLQAQGQVQAARAALQNLEYDSQLLNDKISEVSQRMYGGRVTQPKELQDLQLDLASLQRRRGVLEEQQFEALVTSEAAEAQHQAAQEQLRQADEQAMRRHGDLIRERQQVQANLARLDGDRAALAGNVPAADRELYERLRPTKRGRAVARLEEGMCAGCGVATPPSQQQAARSGISLCVSCGRILCAD